MLFLSAAPEGTAGPPSSWGVWTSSASQVPPGGSVLFLPSLKPLDTEHDHSWKVVNLSSGEILFCGI